jgi:tellurite resistance protein TerC
MATWVQRLIVTAGLDGSPRLKKIIVGVIGTTVLLIGFALVVLPGPAVLVIPVGLAILASEFAWARRVIRRGKVFVGRRFRRGSPRAAEQRAVS